MRLHDRKRLPSRDSPSSYSGILFLFGFFSISLLFAQQPSENSIASHFQAGRQAIQSGHLDLAVVEFKKVLRLDPDLIEAQVNLGLAYHLLGQYAESTTVLARAARRQPELTPANLFLGLGYLKLGLQQKAVAPLEQVMRLQPGNREARRALASCYLAGDDYRSAAREFQALFALEPEKSEAWFQLGRDYTGAASRLVGRMSLAHRRTAWGHRLAGDLYYQTQRWEMAAQEYLEALSVDSSQPGLHAALGNTYLQQKRLAEADAQFRAEVSGATDKPHGYHAVLAASDAYAGELARAGHSPEVLYHLARSYQMLADECFRRMEELAPDSWRTHQMRAEAWKLRYDDTQAIREYERAAQMRPDAAELYEELGALYLQHGSPDQARAALAKALKLEPLRARSLYLLGQLHVNERQEEKAIPYLQKAVRYDANLLEARAILGRAYLHAGKPEAAIAEIEKALSLDFYGDLHYLLYRAYHDLGRTEQARAALSRSAEMRKNSVARDRDKLERWMRN